MTLSTPVLPRLRRGISLAAAIALVLTSTMLLGTDRASAVPLTGEVTISGTPAPGRTITANPVGWDSNTTFEYAWTRSGAPAAATRNIRLSDTDTAGVIYRVTVTAQKSGFEDGSAQAEVTVQTAIPGSPTELSASTVGRTIALAWTAPANTGGDTLVTYRIQYRPLNGGSWRTFEHADSTVPSLTVTGLQGSTAYQFRVSAVNVMGASIPTPPVEATTGPPDVPGAIPGTPVAVAGYNLVTVSWAPPANAADAAPLTYKIECYRYGGSAAQNNTGYLYREWVPCVPDTGALTPNSSGRLTYTVRGVPRYATNFRVTAQNAVGVGPTTAQSNRVTPNATRPSSARALTNVVATDGMSITFRWQPPANLYGTPLDHYELRWYQSGSYRALPDANEGKTTGPSTTYIWTGYEDDDAAADVPLGKNFYVRVYACNTENVCSSSGPRTRVRLGTPRPATVIHTTGHDGEAYVSWTPGVVSGAYGPTAYYELQYRPGRNGTWITEGADTFPVLKSANPNVTILGLTNGETYQVRVRAFGFNNRASGWLTSAAAADARPVVGGGRALVAPTNVLGEIGVEKVKLTWTAPDPSADQPAASDYLIERATSLSGPWATVKRAASANTEATVTGLRAGNEYYFRVRSINTNGISLATPVGPFSPLPGTMPGAPTDVTGQGDTNSVDLSWVRPVDDGGIPIIDYTIEYREVGSTDWLPVEVEDGDEDDGDGDDGDDEEVEAPTTYLLTGLDIDTAYEFRVAAVNHISQGPWSDTARVTTGILPEMPTELTAVGRDQAAGLRWTAPTYSGSQPILGYQIEYRPQGSSDSWQILNTMSDTTIATVRGLVNGTVYDFQVRTMTYVGVSEPAMTTAIPGGLPLCDAPIGLNGQAGYTSAALAWTAPGNAVACALEDYVVEYRLSEDPSWSAWAEWDHEPSRETNAGVQDLLHGKSYDFRVMGYNGALSDPSNVLTLTIDGDVDFAYAPEDVWAEPDYSQVVLHWSAPTWDGGSPIIDYVIQVKAASVAVWDVFPDAQSTDLESILALDPAIAYNCRVAAKNGLGRGPYSESVDCQSLVPPSVPGAPTNLTATAADQAADLAWSAPADDGGADITGYVVRSRPSGGTWTEQQVSATPLSTRVTGLTNGTAYDFQVAAVNMAGRGPWSNEATATPDDGVVPPSAAPSNLKADVTTACERVTVTWDALAGSVVDSYTLAYKATSDSAWQDQQVEATQTSVTLAGLTAGSYDFRVRAANHKGAGPWSSPISATVTACLVPPVAVPQLTADGQDAQVVLTWTLQGDTTGIADYDVRYRTKGSTTWTERSLGTAGLTATITGLSNDDTYEFQIRPTNEAGPGPWSNLAEATPVADATVPGAPLDLTPQAGDQRVDLTWIAPADGGSALTGYTIRYRAGQGTWQTQTAPAAATAATVSGLVNGTPYAFQIQASNAVGAGPWSDPAQATPVADATVPGAPSGLTAAPHDAEVSLAWQAPASDGGSAVTGYTIRYRVTGQPTWQSQTGSTALSASVRSLVNGTSYDFQVAAVNALGTGPWSATATATPVAASTVPSAPQNLQAVSGNASIALTWSAPASDGGEAVTGYTVRFRSAGQPWLTQENPADARSTTIAGLTNFTAYEFQILASNAVGAGPWSSVVTATPGVNVGLPGAPTGLVAAGGDQQVALTWVAPVDDSGQRVTSYLIREWVDGGTPAVIPSGSDGTAMTILNRVNGTTYHYQVAAVNGVGTGPWSEAASATPDAGRTNTPTAPLDLRATAGDTVVGLRWSAPASNGGSPISDYTVGYRANGTTTWTTVRIGSDATVFSVTGLTNGTAYEFVVAAVNAIGQGVWSDIAAATPGAGLGQLPGAPQNVQATAGNGEVGLSWRAPASDGGSPISDYVVQYKSAADSVWRSLALGSNATLATVRSLVNGQAYAFRVAAINDIGIGPWSIPVSATPDAAGARTPGQPTGLTATAGNTQVGLAWTPPADNGGSALVDYVVQFKAASNNVWQSVRIDSTATRFTVTGLANGMAYDFRVAAVNAIGVGEFSAPASATPSAAAFQVPGPPINLAATAGDTQVGLSWAAPARDGGTPVTQYAVAFRTNPDGPWIVRDTGSTTPRYTVQDLVNGQPYDFKVAAVNALGQGDWSQPVLRVTPEADLGRVPAGPVLIAMAGDTMVHLTWTPATADANAPVTDYIIEYRPTGGVWVSVDTQSTDLDHTVSGLVNGTAYEFRVAGLNRIGLGNWSATVTSRPDTGLGRLPGAPTDLVATAGNAAVGLSWTAPADNGGRAIVAYKIARWTAGQTPIVSVTDSDATLAAITNLVNQTTYNFKVAAVNALGTGPWSTEASATPQANLLSPPGAPTNLAATAGDEVVGLTWTAPTNTGGGPISDYAVSYKPQAAATWTTVRIGSDATAYAVTGLTNGTVYDFRVAAINALGLGAWSSTASATPNTGQGRLPSEPRELTATAGNTEVGLAWSAPLSSGGSPISDYIVQYKATTEPTWHSQSIGSDATVATIRGLDNGTQYAFRVAAVNRIGVGPWSVPATATPDALGDRTPGAPVQLVATAGNGEVGLAWQEPTADGGQPVTDYVVQYKTGAETTWHSQAQGSNATLATIKSLANGTAYSFRVAAVNGIGIGPWSTPATATPVATAAKTPGQPTSLQATAGNTQVGLAWVAPAADGGSPVVDYVVEYQSVGQSVWQSVRIGSTATRHTITGLTNGQAYNFKVAAVNGIGRGDFSTPASATPTAAGLKVPSQPTGLVATPGDTQIGLYWAPPADDGGSPVRQYAVAYRISPDGPWQVAQTDSPDWEYTIQNLANGTAYDAKVAAINDLGMGGWSDVVTGVTPQLGLGRVPLAPTASATPGDGMVVLRWTEAPAESDAPVTTYVIDYRPQGGHWLTTATGGHEREFAFDGLANGTPYEFRVAGVNRIGRGDWSAIVAAEPAAGLGRVPTAPINLTATPGNAQVGLSWTKPASDGGHPITVYQIDYWTGTEPVSRLVLDSDATQVTVTGLTNGSPYLFSVAAVNQIGRGPADEAGATPLASLAAAPGVPTSLRAQPGDGVVGLTWQAPANDGGSGLVDYLVSYKTTAAATWTTQAVGSDATHFAVSGLTNGTLYDFRVAAVNGIGPGEWSEQAEATPNVGLGHLPSAPPNLVATPGNAEVGLTWDAPTANGGSPVGDYVVQYRTAAETRWHSQTLGSNATWATVRALTNGTAYTFRVAAVNGIGIGPWSNTVEATPDATLAQTPGQPTQLVATPGNTVVGLAWTAPAVDGRSPVTDYAVSYRAVGDRTWTVERIGSNLAAHTVTGLVNGTAYEFTVAAINAIGVGQASNVATATPDASLSKQPGAPTNLVAGVGNTEVGLRWSAPADDGGSPITRYSVAYKASADAAWITVTTLDATPWATIANLANGQAFDFKVAAHNAIGVGPWSAPVTATPDAAAGHTPAAPTALAATPGNTEVGLAWQPAGNAEPPTTSYAVAHKATATSEWTISILDSDVARATIRELANGTSYDFKVAAINAVGVSPWSDVAQATPDARYAKTPAAPAGLTANPGDGLVGLSWTAPADNGSPIESYVVYYRTANAAQWQTIETDSTATVATVPGLTNGQAYEFKVAAVNGIGLGLDSAVAKATPDAQFGTVPSAPGQVQAEAGNAQLQVTWAKPDDTGKSDVQAYVVEYREQGATTWQAVTVTGDKTQVALSDLTNGTPYEVRVTAVNAIGPGAPSAVVVATPTYGPTVKVTPSAVKAGQAVTITGAGFTPGEKVTGQVRSDPVDLGPATVDAQGRVTFTWTVPKTFTLGAHEGVVIDAGGTPFKAPFTVLPAEIEKTGAQTTGLTAGAAAAATALGLVFLMFAWRRRQAEEASLLPRPRRGI